jgi:predicted nucleotidyltransferase
MNARDLLKEKRAQILRIAERYGTKNIRVFGSTARGDSGPESDVDFLVELEPGRNLFDLGGFLYEVRELLGCPVDVVTEKGLREHVRSNVLKEATPL